MLALSPMSTSSPCVIQVPTVLSAVTGSGAPPPLPPPHPANAQAMDRGSSKGLDDTAAIAECLLMTFFPWVDGVGGGAKAQRNRLGRMERMGNSPGFVVDKTRCSLRRAPPPDVVARLRRKWDAGFACTRLQSWSIGRGCDARLDGG